MFIKVKCYQTNKFELLNVNHIIRVIPHKLTNYKIGEQDKRLVKIESTGAMVSSVLVDSTVDEIRELINNQLIN